MERCVRFAVCTYFLGTHLKAQLSTSNQTLNSWYKRLEQWLKMGISFPNSHKINQAQPRTRNAQAPKVWPAAINTTRATRSTGFLHMDFNPLLHSSCCFSSKLSHCAGNRWRDGDRVTARGKNGVWHIVGWKEITVALRGQIDCSLRKTQQIFFKMLKRCTKHNKSWIKHNTNS